jgi:hypothetical protein
VSHSTRINNIDVKQREIRVDCFFSVCSSFCFSQIELRSLSRRIKLVCIEYVLLFKCCITQGNVHIFISLHDSSAQTQHVGHVLNMTTVDINPTSPSHRTSMSMCDTHQSHKRLDRVRRSTDIDIVDNRLTTSNTGWQQFSSRTPHIVPAPDVVYRNTYMKAIKRDQSSTLTNDVHAHLVRSCALSTVSQRKSPKSYRHQTNELSSRHVVRHQCQTVYDCIRHSIRQIEQQRQVRESYDSQRIERPQNHDSVLHRALRMNNDSTRSSARLTRTDRKLHDDLRCSKSLINCINYNAHEQLCSSRMSTHDRYSRQQLTYQRSSSILNKTD